MRRDIQLVIPMAGTGSRFSAAGYETPKPLLDVHGMPMFEVVVRNLLDPRIERITLIARAEWRLRQATQQLEQDLAIRVDLIEIANTTAGAAETVEQARDILLGDQPVVTANSDQYVATQLTQFYDALDAPGVDGVILTMGDDDPKWSYVAITGESQALEVREKEVISPFATVGIYGFSSAALMFDAFGEMRAAGDRINGELYVAPSFNYLIRRGLEIEVVHLGPIGDIMHGMGIPEDYEAFIRSEVSRRAARP